MWWWCDDDVMMMWWWCEDECDCLHFGWPHTYVMIAFWMTTHIHMIALWMTTLDGCALDDWMLAHIHDDCILDDHTWWLRSGWFQKMFNINIHDGCALDDCTLDGRALDVGNNPVYSLGHYSSPLRAIFQPTNEVVRADQSEKRQTRAWIRMGNTWQRVYPTGVVP